MGKNLNYNQLRMARDLAQKKKEEKKKKKIIITVCVIVGIALLIAAAIVASTLIKNAKDKERRAELYPRLENVTEEKVPSVVDLLEERDFEETDEETDYIIIDVKKYGKIVCQLREDIAPITVKNIKKLVLEKFYDGLIFHRVIEGFMIQGGGLTKSYAQKEAASIKGEFASNGVENNLLHYRGVLSMARTNVKDSASSQFFIMHQTSPHLDGDYAAFGYVLAGMDVVDKIATVKTNSGDMPIDNVVIESIRFAKKK